MYKNHKTPKNPKAEECSRDIVKNNDRISMLEQQLSKMAEFAKQMRDMIDQRDMEIARLKGTLEKINPKEDSASPLFFTDEELICIKQIDALNNISKSRLLTLEEIKALDLLIKNKRLAQRQPTVIPYTPDKKREFTKDELILIAETSSIIDGEYGD